MLSIVVPTYNEGDNVFSVAERVQNVLKDRAYEIIFVDDSKDDTPDRLQKLCEIDKHVRYEHRTNERGLGTAVVRGFVLSKGDVLMVMDADLQHPPEMIPQMIEAVENGADVVIPSRFIPGGDDGGLNLFRKLVSATARYMGKIALKALRPINDPTSGYFMFRKAVIEGIRLEPIGWKILIEILAKGHYKDVTEVPYRFNKRAAGESKMSLQEQLNYLRHLYTLIKYSPDDRRFYVFAMVGVSGVFVNMLIFSFLVRIKFMVSVAGTISALAAMVSNFILNDRLTWAEIRTSSSLTRASKFVVTSVFGIGINVLLLSFLFYYFHFNYMIANLIGICIATLWNYSINNLWTWRCKDEVVSINVKQQPAPLSSKVGVHW